MTRDFARLAFGFLAISAALIGAGFALQAVAS
jgi:hypothetical protein